MGRLRELRPDEWGRRRYLSRSDLIESCGGVVIAGQRKLRAPQPAMVSLLRLLSKEIVARRDSQGRMIISSSTLISPVQRFDRIGVCCHVENTGRQNPTRR